MHDFSTSHINHPLTETEEFWSNAVADTLAKVATEEGMDHGMQSDFGMRIKVTGKHVKLQVWAMRLTDEKGNVGSWDEWSQRYLDEAVEAVVGAFRSHKLASVSTRSNERFLVGRDTYAGSTDDLLKALNAVRSEHRIPLLSAPTLSRGK